MLKPGSKFRSVEEAWLELGADVKGRAYLARAEFLGLFGFAPNPNRLEGQRRLWVDERRSVDLNGAIEWSSLQARAIEKRDRIQLADTWSAVFYDRASSMSIGVLKGAERAAAEEIKAASAVFASEVEAVLERLDGIDGYWRDEGVFRTCRDRLRKALGAFKAAGAEGGGA